MTKQTNNGTTAPNIQRQTLFKAGIIQIQTQSRYNDNDRIIVIQFNRLIRSGNEKKREQIEARMDLVLDNFKYLIKSKPHMRTIVNEINNINEEK